LLPPLRVPSFADLEIPSPNTTPQKPLETNPPTGLFFECTLGAVGNLSILLLWRFPPPDFYGVLAEKVGLLTNVCVTVLPPQQPPS